MHSTYNPSRLSRWITIRGPWPTKPTVHSPVHGLWNEGTGAGESSFLPSPFRETGRYLDKETGGGKQRAASSEQGGRG